jgi:hypothetical protein
MSVASNLFDWDQAGKVTGYGYDQVGNRISQTDAPL